MGFFFLPAYIFLPVSVAGATSVDDLQKSIDAKNAQIDALNNDIKQLNDQITGVSTQSQTLQSTIKVLDVSGSKLSKQIDVTQTKIGVTGSTIEEIGLQIAQKNQNIEDSRGALAQSIRSINEADSYSLIESFLTEATLATLWNDIAALEEFQTNVRTNVKSLQDLTAELGQKKDGLAAQKSQLEDLQAQLSDQKKIVDNTKKEKTTLLTQTKSKESDYLKQLAEKKRIGDAFNQELTAYESQLKLIIDPTSYPHAGKGILSWPLDHIFVTQYFGNTEFAKQTAAYNGKGHNGVDFRATTGTLVKAALSGVVAGTGNSDLVPGCYSYGKWILLQHDNGLSTLYAHLSLIRVVPGQHVNTGDIIAYSGHTGYVVPPGPAGSHLHFGLYVTEGVKIVQYTNSINCKNAVIPVADLKAYLNPLDYL